MSSSNSVAKAVVVEMKNHVLTSAADLSRRTYMETYYTETVA
jgi:hypothetical protein